MPSSVPGGTVSDGVVSGGFVLLPGAFASDEQLMHAIDSNTLNKIGVYFMVRAPDAMTHDFQFWALAK